jgi:hypothetical protein
MHVLDHNAVLRSDTERLYHLDDLLGSRQYRLATATATGRLMDGCAPA